MFKDGSEQFIASNQYDVPGNDHVNEPFVSTFPEIPDVSVIVPAQGTNGTQPGGAGGFRWLTVTAQVDTEGIGEGVTLETPGLATFYVELATDPSTRIKIGTIDNTNAGAAVNMAGLVRVGYWDPFSSRTDFPIFQFGIFDNVRVYDAWIIEDEPELQADFDGDGQLSAVDIDLLSVAVGSGEMMFDLDGNGAVEEEDRRIWVEDVFGTFFGDADLNKEVAFDDFLALSSNFGLDGGWEKGDFG